MEQNNANNLDEIFSKDEPKSLRHMTLIFFSAVTNDRKKEWTKGLKFLN